MIALLLRRPILAVVAVFEIFADANALARAAERRYPFIEG